MKNLNICPYVRFAMHHVWMKGMYLDRILWDNEIIFIESGEMNLVIAKKKYVLKENDLVFIPPGVRHEISYSGVDCRQPHVHFDFYHYPDSEDVGISSITYEQMSDEEKSHIRPDFMKENDYEIPPVIHLYNPYKIKTLLFKIIDEYTKNNIFCEYQLAGLMTELIGEILFEIKNNGNDIEQTNTTSKIVNYMHECIDYNITLENISERFNVSKWQIINLFNKELGITPQKYYGQIRIKRAKDLVSYSCLTITQISNLMGFLDPHTFSRWFKNMDGKYPSEYRNTSKIEK